MKIISVTNLFPDAGNPTLGIHNARLLHALAEEHEIRVLGLRPVLPWGSAHWETRAEDNILKPEFIRTLYLPRIGSRVNTSLYARSIRQPLLEMQQEFKADVVMAPWLFPDACATARITRELGVPMVAVAMGTDVHQYRHDSVRLKTMQRNLAGCHIITRSKQLAFEVGEMAISDTIATPVYNGADLDVFSSGNKQQAREQLGLHAEAPILLYVGNFLEIKRPKLAVQVIEALRKEKAFADARLIMIGDGDLFGDIKLMSGEREWLTLLGRLPPEIVCKYMQASDVVVVTSRNEGVPNVMREAFACGRPVVATHVGGIPELMTKPFLGVTCQPEPLHDLPERFSKAIADCLKFHDSSQKIRAHAEREYSWHHCCKEYTRVLESAIAR